MANDQVPDHRAEWWKDAISRVVGVLYEAELMRCKPEVLLNSARKCFEQLRKEEIVRDALEVQRDLAVERHENNQQVNWTRSRSRGR